MTRTQAEFQQEIAEYDRYSGRGLPDFVLVYIRLLERALVMASWETSEKPLSQIDASQRWFAAAAEEESHE